MDFTTTALAEFSRGVTFENLPGDVIVGAERAVLDTLASLLGGVPTTNADQMRKASRVMFGEGEYPVWFSPTPDLHFGGAILSNCAAASSLDVDDGHRGAAGHPGAAVVPAVLMEAARNNHSGREVLAAICIGYDVGCRIAESRRFTDDMSFASGRWTCYGVAAAIGWLRGLSVSEMANAIAIAGQEAPVNLPQGACMSSSVKGSSPWSTLSSFFAVDRACAGATGSIDLLDRPMEYDVEKITDQLGLRWLITECYQKPYASCRYTHSILDSVFAIKRKHEIKGSDITRIDIEFFPEGERLPNDLCPSSLEAAQFSTPFTTALAAMRDEQAFRPLSPECLTDEKVLNLARRVSITYPARYAGVFPDMMPSKVSIDCNGRIHAMEVHIPKGDYRDPLSAKDLESKLFAFGANVVEEGEMTRLIQAIAELRNNAQYLFDVLTCSSRDLD